MSARDFLDREPFHALALAAFVDQAVAEHGWPNPEATKRRAYAYYEMLLAAASLEATPAAEPVPAHTTSAD